MASVKVMNHFKGRGIDAFQPLCGQIIVIEVLIHISIDFTLRLTAFLSFQEDIQFKNGLTINYST